MQDFGVPLGPLVSPPGAQSPDGRDLVGRTVRLEKLDAAVHGADLWHCAQAEPIDRWAYLGEVGPFSSAAAFNTWLEDHETSADPYFYAIIPEGQGAQGWLSLMRHDIPNGVIETGYIWISDQMARTPASTEAMYLAMRYVFEGLSMRRYEWKCNALNQPSCAAAERLGFTFEGIFRQHQITRGRNRDTAWYSILDHEWPRVKAAFQAWLAVDNFDEQGRQKGRLQDFRNA